MRNVLTSLTQRRQLDLDHFQPVIQIFSEAAVVNQCREVAMGSGNHTDIDRDSFLAADRSDLPFLQRAQQLDLEGEIKIADISKKGGGRLRPHSSHQAGRDVDIRLPRRKGSSKEDNSVSAIDSLMCGRLVSSSIA